MATEDKTGIRLEDGGFLAVVLIVTMLFGWLIAPFFGAILWSLVAAILFEPLTRRLSVRIGNHPNTAALLMLLALLALIIVPAFLLGIALVNEAANLYLRLREGHLDVGQMISDVREALPTRLRVLIDQYGNTDVDTLREMFGSGLATGLKEIASRALLFGQGALSLLATLGVMLYLTFFLLRDGQRMGDLIKAAVPLRPNLRDALIHHFVIVVRATMKGTVAVALAQGTIGGLIFWMLGIEGALLWGVFMGFFSLLPAIGSGIVWVPVAIYLFVTGSIQQSVILVLCGVFVISVVDNILRPILVGRDTRMPDFVVLIATLAGLQLFGLNGFIVGPVIAALFIAVWKMVAELRAPQPEPGAELALEDQPPRDPA
ncbi:AI-2E family transporter [Novosphingobium sp. PC22D]|uniref:AI-2E family transporter n=1 Tax=Novosphingobium sp. PC22D TaxID=1962403 RepID=UPI000BF0DF6E|nr:AI-2E family transporter [Novosphingobium sp. PC22D]PEQ14616.1 AI-2E family transporter [Novosphingobium sp. PC22D]